ncbi:hypothetical protein AB0K20_17525 [Micromonospora matsumotoense]|uniref:hypothetical protein n=1 Tax=Micromonospora matsumotoense TaxID=121616 RepID=UPI0034278026
MELPRHWTIVSSDIVNSSAGGYPRQSDLATAVEQIIGRIEHRCPYPGRWIRRERGDGELVLIPADVPIAWVLAGLLPQLRQEILDHNRNKHPDHRLRLRIGVDCGDVSVDAAGVPRGGDAIVDATRLRDCSASREATFAVPGAPVVAVVSDAVYRRVVPANALGMEPWMFRSVRAVVLDKTFQAHAWLHLPAHQPPAVSAMPDEPAPPRTDDRPAPTSADDRPASPSAGDPRRVADLARRATDAHRVHDGRQQGDNVGQTVYGDHATVTNHGPISKGGGSA